MPFNPMMIKNTQRRLPKEKVKKPPTSIRERLLCWSKLLMAAVLSSGKIIKLLTEIITQTMVVHQVWCHCCF